MDLDTCVFFRTPSKSQPRSIWALFGIGRPFLDSVAAHRVSTWTCPLTSASRFCQRPLFYLTHRSAAQLDATTATAQGVSTLPRGIASKIRSARAEREPSRELTSRAHKVEPSCNQARPALLLHFLPSGPKSGFSPQGWSAPWRQLYTQELGCGRMPCL